MLYFTSDIHFSDTETFNLERRPFKNVQEFDKQIIKLWNKTMTENDTLYVVGDLLDCDGKESMGWEQTIKYIKKIKPQIILIIGNNEQRIIDCFFDGDFNKFRDYCLSNGISEVVENLELEIDGIKFYLTHEPKDYKKGYVNLCGHLHRSRGLWYSFGLNMSCDLNHFRPYTKEELFFILSQKEKFYANDKNFKVI